MPNFRGHLYYISPISINIPSILEHGILSYERASSVCPSHQSFAMDSVQQRRDRVVVTNAKPLHTYVNLYFDARNPALFIRRDFAQSLCILVVDGSILKLPDVVITDMNAAAIFVKFMEPAELDTLDFGLIYATYWIDPSVPTHKQQKCAEVLVPGMIPFKYVTGARVVDEVAKAALIATGFPPGLITVDRQIFFK